MTPSAPALPSSKPATPFRSRFAAALLGILGSMSSAPAAMTWSGDAGPWGPGPMNDCIATWNTYSNYNFNIPVVYGSGTPTADSSYLGQIRFGGQGNYRVAMHESSHWMGTGTVNEWGLHQRNATWNGTYGFNLRAAYDGPGERHFIYGVHYGPQGANYDSEGVQAPQMVGIIGAMRRDMDLWQGDQTIGIASGTYRLRSRVSAKLLDSMGAIAEGAQPKQGETANGDNSQLWNVNLIAGTTYFTLQNVASGKYLDSLGAAANGAAPGLTSLAGAATDSQLWQIQQTDSCFFKIVNKANGKGIDNAGANGEGAGMIQWDAAGNGSWNQQWAFMHRMAQTAPPVGVVSQGRPVASSSTDGNNYDWKGNNGVSGDRWTASSGSFPQWWRVDTGAVQPITKVEVDWFPDGAPTFKYRIEVSNDAANWTVAADRTANNVTGTTVDRFTGVTGRFVQVVITGASAGWAAFMECRVYNEAQSLKLLSLHRPCNANSEQAGNLAVNANNVDPVFTRWCSNSAAYPGWWQVDLGSAQQVNRAVISWFDDDARSYKYRVEGSLDGTNYFTLADHTDNTTPYTTSDSFSGIARWVRIYVTGGSSSYPSIYDAQIYGSTVPQGPGTPVLTATPTGSQIVLNWNAVAGATSYTLKRSLVPGGPYTTLVTQAGTSYTDNAVSSGVAYHYVVAATNGTGTSANSAQASAATGSSLVACLPFDEGAGGLAADVSGFGRNGTLINGAGWGTGNIAAAVDLDGTDDYVALTPGVVSGLNDFTIAVWVNPDVNATWARAWDFGTDNTNYMFLAPAGTSGVRFAIRTPAVAEQIVDTGSVLPPNTWSHVAVTLSGNTATLYINGAVAGTNNAVSLRPSSLGVTTQNWIGRSQYADPYFNGRIDDLRIYNRALIPAELARLRGLSSPFAPASLTGRPGGSQALLNWAPSIGATSYKVKRASSSGGTYSLIATVNAAGYTDTGLSNGSSYFYVVSAQNAAGQSPDSPEAAVTPAPVAPAPPEAPANLYPYEVSAQVKLSWAASAGASAYKVKRGTSSSGPFTEIGTAGTTTFTDATALSGTTYYYVVSALGSGGAESGNSNQTSATASAGLPLLSLKMDEATGTLAADDSGNGLDATLVNGPTHVAGRLDRAINFDGTNDHATLPAGVVSTVNDCTVSAWVRASATSTWARIFDFGNGTTNYMVLTTKAPTGNPRFVIRTPDSGEQIIESSVALPLNAWTHVAITISGNTGTMYLNGVVVGGNGVMNLKPSSLGSTTQNYLGRSQFADPYFAGMIDEFQIRDRALSAAEIADLAAPPNAPSGLNATAGSSSVGLSWNSVGGATGYTVKRSTTNGGPYAVVASKLAASSYNDAGLTPGTTYYYVVTTNKGVAESARSGQSSATPTSLTPQEAWRQTYFGTTQNSGDAADNADPDGDGWSNANEYAAGTNPTDRNSTLSASVTRGGGADISISFASVAGRHYTVEYSETLAAGAWQAVAGANNLTGTGGVMQVTDSGGASHPWRFYRIEVGP